MTRLTTEAADLIATIRHQTALHNRNNLTRTNAYLSFYREYPEVEWALLAHMVSRNGGWNMTDLRGEWLPRIMSAQEIQASFAFLERCNWLIFHDAYPQLLLYKVMKQEGVDLTSLLPKMGVSRFMVPVWRDFLDSGNAQRLSRALIVNEQQYIEQRVVHNAYYQNQVLQTLPFLAQAVLSLNKVLFPYRAHAEDDQPRLVGVSVKNFPSVEARMNVGITLYKLLFADRKRLAAITDWATDVPHTGSRADYWPHLFTPVRQRLTEKEYQKRLAGNQLLPGRPKLYSPPLAQAWPDTVQPAADGVDWYRDERWLRYLEEEDAVPTIDETDYLQGISLLESSLQLVSFLS